MHPKTCILPHPLIWYYLVQKIDYLSSQISPVKLEAHCSRQSGALPKLHQEDAAQCRPPSQQHPYLQLLTVISNCFPSLTTWHCQPGPPQLHVIYLSNANDSSCTRSLRNVGYFLCLYLHEKRLYCLYFLSQPPDCLLRHQISTMSSRLVMLLANRTDQTVAKLWLSCQISLW